MAEVPATRASRRTSRQRFPALGLAAASLGASTFLILTRERTAGGFTALVAALALLAGSPRVFRRRVGRAFLLSRFLDRAFDFCILIPVAWINRTASLREAVLAVLAAGASYLAAYEHVKSTSLGYASIERQGYRAGRYGLLVIGLLTGRVEASLWAFVGLTLAASAVRAANVARQERRAGAATRRRELDGPIPR
jgi:hypothetical protein